MKNRTIAFIVLMFIVSLLQPAKAATTAMSVTGPGGVTILASTETGWTASTEKFTAGSAIVMFQKGSDYVGLYLMNRIFNQPLTPGAYVLDTVFPSSIPGAILGELGISGNSETNASGPFTITEIAKDSFTTDLTKFAGDGRLTVQGVEYLVSVRFNSQYALAAQVPEPSTLLLFLIGPMSVLMRRQR